MSTQSALRTADASERRRSQRSHHIVPPLIRGDSNHGIRNVKEFGIDSGCAAYIKPASGPSCVIKRALSAGLLPAPTKYSLLDP